MGKHKEAKAPAPGGTHVNPMAAWPFPKAPAPQTTDETVPAGEPPAAERIRVDQVRLYTDPTQNTVERIALANLVESPFNPRTTYNQRRLEELADSIRTAGVMQPILVRRMSVDGLLAFNREHRNDDGPRPEFEIVFGHRRTRAARLAGEETVPAIVRELTDTQAAQLQAIENVQREDLNPIETATSYQQYIEAHHVSKDQLASEIGLSKSHVYGYLKLLTAVPLIKDAVARGEIGPDVALTIARLHTSKLQERALAAIKGKYYDLEDGGKKSVRQIQAFLAEKFTLGLKEAIFDPKDAQLLPDAGACTTCPKRTGNAPEYQDLAEDGLTGYGQKRKGDANLCTDPDCFDAKKKAHLSVEAGKLAAKGKTVIEGAKARQAVGADGKVKGAYVALKDVKAQIAKAGKKAADLPVVVIQDPRDGKTIEAVKVDEIKAAGVKVKAPQGRNDRGNYEEQQRRNREERERREAKAAEETRFNVALLAAVRQAAAGQPLSVLALQLVTAAAVAGVPYEAHGLLAKLHDCKSLRDLQGKVGSLPADRLTTLLLDCALVDHVVVEAYDLRKPEPLLIAAKHYGVDVDQVRRDLADKPADTQTKDLLEQQEEHRDEKEEA